MITIDKTYLKAFAKPREKNAHKGTFGHLLMVCGNRMMPGAAVLATGAALQSGCGLVTLHTTYSAALAAVSAFPSAMIDEDAGDCFSMVPDRLSRFAAIGVGPGLGRSLQTFEALHSMMEEAQMCCVPMTIDADALNIIAEHPEMMKIIPKGSLMTPHIGELKRLVTSDSDAEVWRLCRESGCVVLVKGWHTRIYTPEGEMMVNTTGNAGMAKGGSGDVLTGLCAGLMARGYSARQAAALGVWIHGYAGDWLTEQRTAEAYNSRELIDQLWRGFKEVYHFHADE